MADVIPIGPMRRETVLAGLGERFEAKAIHVGARLDVRGVDSHLSSQLPLIVEVPPAGYAVLLRSGVIVTFGVDEGRQKRFLADLAWRFLDRHAQFESEHAVIRVAGVDGVEPDALVVEKTTIGRLQVIAEALAKSVVLARQEQVIAEAFMAIEPLAIQMTETPERLPWRRKDLVRHIGGALLAQHRIVGSAEALEKPDLLWDNPQLDRLYTRLADEYELRERHLALDRKLAVVSQSARTMLDLQQNRRSYKVEWYIVGLFVFEIAFNLVELALRS